jgi:branched-chain amino acid transport system substrate-binding protein
MHLFIFSCNCNISFKFIVALGFWISYFTFSLNTQKSHRKHGFNRMLSAGLKRWACLLSIMVLSTGCGGAGVRTEGRATRPDTDGYDFLKQGIQHYSAGRYEQAIPAFDRLLAKAAPQDSQLVYLSVYYGIRSRLATGKDLSADSLYDSFQRTIPGDQHRELEFLLRRIKAPPKGEQYPSEERLIAYKLGVILPLSGQFSQFGKAILEGIELAVEEFNRNLQEGREVILDIRDDSSDPIRTAILGRALAADSTVAGLIGSYENETSLAIALVAAATGLPLVCPTADAPGLDYLGSMVHVLNRTDPELARELARFAVDGLKLHTFAILASDDERGNLLADTFARAVRESRGVVVSNQRYSGQTSTFENQLNLLQRYLPDAVYLPAKTNEITQIASQVYYYGLGDVRLLGAEYWDSERVIRLGGEYVDGAVFASAFYAEGEGLRWKEFKELYETTHRRPVNRYSALGYDAAAIILAAAGSMPSHRQLLARNLNRFLHFSGAMGIYSVEDSGLVRRKVFILELSQGNVVPARGFEPLKENGDKAFPDSIPGSAAAGEEPNNN